jgi:dipeptidyl aminopeptidase/acylaminoacyl peptidase
MSVKEGRATMHWRDDKQPDWQLLAEFDALDWPYWPVHVDDQGNLLVLESSGPGGVDVLKRFDMATRRPAAQALVSTPGFSVGRGLEVDERSGRLLGVHVDTDAYGVVWFDPRMKAVQAEADKRWPDRVNQLSCARCLEPDMVVLLRSWSDRDPGQFWVHRVADKSWQKVGDSRPGVDPRRMATLDFHRTKARDGKDLPLWLTLPAGHKKGDRPPAVVLVHGGPWVRGGHWAWNPMAQFLASRGYAVIEPEYRGSTGFGGAHFRAGWKQWGTTMQDDVADALEWARQQGHVSASQACIAGASYGGYAALMGPIRHPQLYRCAVAWVAVTDPLLLTQWSAVSDQSDESRDYSLPQLIGDPVADLPMLKAASPLQRAGELKLPLLLGFGADDRRVPLEHGTRLRDALKTQGHDPEWVVYPGEGHGAWTLEHQLDWAGRVERFLAQHLK